MHIEPYTPSECPLWDEFVAASRNATFLHRRDYMDYHADRFTDASLMLYDNHRRLVALLPAAAAGDTVSSHAGLTYGGWLLGPSKPDVTAMLEGFELMRDYYRSRSFATLIYTPVPHIYHRYPAEEDLYALFRSGATVERVLPSSVIDLRNPVRFNTGARRHISHAALQGPVVSRDDDFPAFWDVLSDRLRERYGATPVHTLAEIQLLHGRFSDEIQLWTVRCPAGEMIAGTVLFVCGHTVKAQYIASSERGRRINALDYLFSHLVGHFTARGMHYFDLGPSCENHGLILNEGLVSQKSSYGARAVAYTSYRLAL